MMRDGTDVTENYLRGAEHAYNTCVLHGAGIVLLKERSPSCGKGRIYDGTFSGTLTDRDGVTAEYLLARGIRVFGSLGTLEELNPKGPLDMCSLACKRAMVPLVDVVNLGGFSVMAFPVQHDAREPTGFLIRYRPTGEQIVYATDTYYLKYTFPGTTYWIMECNYCEDLIEGETNEVLRQRLRESHMSLRRLQGVFRANDMSVAAKVVLVHLSDKRSDEVRMLEGIADATLMKAGEEIVAAHNGDLIELAKTPF